MAPPTVYVMTLTYFDTFQIHEGSRVCVSSTFVPTQAASFVSSCSWSMCILFIVQVSAGGNAARINWPSCGDCAYKPLVLGILFSLVPSCSLGTIINRQSHVDWGQISDHSWHQQIGGCDYKKHKQLVCWAGLEFHSRIYINPASKWQRWLNKETTRMIPQRRPQTAQTDIWEARWETRPGTHSVFNSTVNVAVLLPLDFKQRVIEKKIH